MAVRRLMKEQGPLEILSRAELIRTIECLQTDPLDRDKALIAFLYLTGCRIEEVCWYKRYRGTSPDGLDHFKEPIKRKQVKRSEHKCRIYQVRSLKRRDEIHRTIPINLNIKSERPLRNYFWRWVKRLSPEDYIFDITRQRAYQILETVNLFPHYLRHIRNTHLVQDYSFTGQELQQFNGWAKSTTADVYVHLDVKDLERKMSVKE